jgi:uncharacterized membrane protein YccC
MGTMYGFMAKLETWWHSLRHGSANEIAFSWAVRSSCATALPLLIMPFFGFEQASRLLAIGALNTSMVDVGGTYRNRLIAMGLNAVLSPISLILGAGARDHWALATALMFFIALGSGMTRALGPSITPLGLFVGLSFLIGTNLPLGPGVSIDAALLYSAGALWTMFVALAFWRLRPFKRLEQELASVWESVSALVNATNASGEQGAHGRRERLLAQRQVAVRDAVEGARNALGEIREQVSGPGFTAAQLLTLLRAASRITEAFLTIAELRHHHGRYREDPREASALTAFADSADHAIKGISHSLLSGSNKLSLAEVKAESKELLQQFGLSHPETIAVAQIVQYLESAEEVLKVLFGPEHRFRGLLPPLARSRTRTALLGTIRAHCTFSSAIFRHALRVATAAAAGTALTLSLKLPHGIWLPMTTFVVLQPEFGSTLTRALQRTAGTIAGAVIAGVALSELSGFALRLFLAALLFIAFFVHRRRHGLGITFLTPLIVLLITNSVGDPWVDTLVRVVDTIIGAVVGIGAGYVLWPQWERVRVPNLLSRAIRANSEYMVRIIEALSRPITESLPELRRRAEIATGNAEAGFQRLLTEPARHRGSLGRAFALLTYTQRLERHLIALAAQVGVVRVDSSALLELGNLLAAAQEDVASSVESGSCPQPRPAFEHALAPITAVLVGDELTHPNHTVSFLLSRVVSDTVSLHSAAGETEWRKGLGGR